MIRLAVLMIVNTDREKELSVGITDPIKSIQEGDITISLFSFPGVSSQREVPDYRSRIITTIDPGEYTHVLFVDPDDIIVPEGFVSSIRKMVTEGSVGILLKERMLGREHTKHCCRILLETQVAQHYAPLLMGRDGVHKGHPHSDHRYAQEVARELRLPHGDDVAYLYRIHKEQLNDGTIPEHVNRSYAGSSTVKASTAEELRLLNSRIRKIS